MGDRITGAMQRRGMARRLLGILPLSVLIGMLVAMWRKRRQLVPAVQPRLPHWLQPYLQPMLKRMRDRIAKDKFQDLRRQQKATRAGLSGGDDAAPEWHAGLEEPQYEWRQLMNWRIIKWLVARARKHVTSYMDGRLHVDELDMERLSLRKRWDKQDIGQVRNLVGNTPMIAIHLRFMGKRRVVYMKCEQANLTGSLKDRMALHILDRAYADGSLRPGDVIAEASSGNTGIAFSAIGSALGHPVVIFMPDFMSEERKALIRAYGAEIFEISRLQGGFVGSIRMAEDSKKDQEMRGNRVFLPRQFRNDINAEAHYLTTGPEILLQLAQNGLRPAAFVAGVGTGGTIMGVARCMKENCSGAGGKGHVRLHPVEPAESPTLSTGSHQAGKAQQWSLRSQGSHRIQGISDEFVPPVLHLDELDEVVAVPDGDAIIMAQKLARTLGIGAGISAGANLLAAIEVQDRLGGDAVVVSIICDDNKKYLSTDLAKKEPVRPGYRCPHVELLTYQVVSPLSADALETVRDGRWRAGYSQEGLCSELDAKPKGRKR